MQKKLFINSQCVLGFYLPTLYICMYIRNVTREYPFWRTGTLFS